MKGCGNKIGPYDCCTIVTGDAKDLAPTIPDESVDLIFTDPPYPYEYIECFTVLAIVAARILKAGSFCLCYTGHHHFPEVFDRLREHLDYFWLGSINHPASQRRDWLNHIFGGSKPLLFFSKGATTPMAWICDTSTSIRDKRFHEWGQGANVAEYYIARLSAPGQLLWEPFCGGGTVPAVCKMLGRHYLAFEIDPEVAERARERVRNTQPPLFVMEPEQAEFAT